MLLIFLVDVKIQSRTRCAPRTTLNGNLSWGGKWLCVVRTALFLGHIAFNLKVIFAAVEKISGKEQQVFISHFSCQQIQGWVLLILPHRLKEQLVFQIFHSSDREEEQESWWDLVMPLQALLESGILTSARIWLDKAGHVAKAEVFGAEMCNALTRKWLRCTGEQHSIHQVHEHHHGLVGGPDTTIPYRAEILKR